MMDEEKVTGSASESQDAIAQSAPSDVSDQEQKPAEVVSPAPPAAGSPPPDGGTLAWLQVLGAFFLWAATFGVVLSFGLFQTFYVENYLEEYSPSDIAWIGTIQAFLLFFVGSLSGPLFDRGYMRPVLFTGTILEVVGLMTASVARKYYSIFLSLGVCTGIGQGCLFAPSMIIIGTYFTSKRAIASGLSAAGGGIGSVVVTVIFRPLVKSVGFGWCVRIIGFIVLASCLIALALLRQRPSAKRPTKLMDWSAYKQLDYTVFIASMFLVFVGGYIPFYYIPLFAQLKLKTGTDLAFNMLPVLAGGSTLGRILPLLLVPRFGIFPVGGFVILICAFMQFAWTGIHHIGNLAVFALFYGFFSGTIASIPAVAMAQLSPHVGLIGTRMGMALQIGAFGFLIGNPIGGAILDGNGGFDGLQAFGGGTLLASFLCLVATTILYQKRLERQQASQV